MIFPTGYCVIPLDDRPRAEFSCGVPALDSYLHRQASQDARRRVAAPFILLNQTGSIAGYYTLSAFGIDPGDLPDDIARKLPRYPVLPLTLLGRLAISQRYQGLRLGQMLLMDALQRSCRNASEVASIGVIAEAYNKQAWEFYLRHGFIPLKNQPDGLFIPMKTIERSFK